MALHLIVDGYNLLAQTGRIGAGRACIPRWRARPCCATWRPIVNENRMRSRWSLTVGNRDGARNSGSIGSVLRSSFLDGEKKPIR